VKTVAIGSRTFAVEILGHGEYLVNEGNRRHRVYLAGDRTGMQAFFDGQVFTVRASNDASRTANRSHPTDLSAPMPATVAEILVAPGQAVRTGDILITLEAMKMELPIRAPGDGVVKAIGCRVGQMVQPGVALVELETEEPGN
jgi:biotin carboxyl carrier protein